MPRPSLSTPIPYVIETARALATWHDTYNTVARAAHGPSWDGKAELLQLAAHLETADTHLTREQRDDVEATRLRLEAITAGQRCLRSVLASVQLAYEGDVTLNAVLRDFATEAPSRVRSLATARKALNRVVKAIEVHRTRLDATVERSTRHLDEARRVLDQINAAGDLDTREVLETRQATRARDEALTATIRAITLTHLAAEAMELDQPEALADLFKLYDAKNPSPTRRATSDDLLDAGLRGTPLDDDASDGPAPV